MTPRQRQQAIKKALGQMERALNMLGTIPADELPTSDDGAFIDALLFGLVVEMRKAYVKALGLDLSYCKSGN